jgi:hypothetical protein
MAAAVHPSLEAALGAVLARCPSAVRVVVANSFGLPILSAAAPGHDSGRPDTRAAAAADGDAAVQFGVSADALEKLGYGTVLSSVLVRAPGGGVRQSPAGGGVDGIGVGRNTTTTTVLVQHALFPLVVTVELAVAAPSVNGVGDGASPAAATGGDAELLQETLLPALAAALEPLRAEAEAQTG